MSSTTRPTDEEANRMEDIYATLSPQDRQIIVRVAERLLFADPDVVIEDEWGNRYPEQTPELRAQLLDASADPIMSRREWQPTPERLEELKVLAAE